MVSPWPSGWEKSVPKTQVAGSNLCIGYIFLYFIPEAIPKIYLLSKKLWNLVPKIFRDNL